MGILVLSFTELGCDLTSAEDGLERVEDQHSELSVSSDEELA